MQLEIAYGESNAQVNDNIMSMKG